MQPRAQFVPPPFSWKGLLHRRTVRMALALVFQVLLVVPMARGQEASDSLTAAEKKLPVREARRPRFCQTALGVSFPDPGKGFTAADAIGQQVQRMQLPAARASWVWESSATGQRIVVQVTKGIGKTEPDFRNFTTELKSNLTKSRVMSVRDESLSWTAGRGEYTLTAGNEKGVHTVFRCLSRAPKGDRPALVVCLQTIAGAGDPLRDIRTGLELAACKPA